ncbi:MAG TPA: glycine/betaine ABC transporter [Coriobacteriia bacterium]|jgi:ABC-type proline/glycine betaine transport system permease subunit|uniref:ABC transporter permease n=1 Tax=Anaerosoma tenue TaxID=2933588 RepID=UPI00076CE168|nr:proline/glycine betaine ABC transporter permease [Anaerosoma tenue]KUK47951.1 MAG: Binding-protein-dependent transport systems inner membrane component [Actinobacteria bacterium 66_15]MCK8115315.1 proline/glycine betaine ABC transporter permease [Anaerosoma tenue]HAL30995.1 glycine/betaine ABC transporter [Coriobacteriia bacterium]
MMNLDAYRLPVGDWIDAAVDWMTANLGWLFDAIAAFLKSMIEGLETGLLFPSALIFVVLVAAIAFYAKGWRFALFTAISFVVVAMMDLWDATMSTLSLVLVASIVALLIGIPLGIIAARSDRFSGLIKPVLDLMQTMPSLVYLIPAIVFFGIGQVPGVVATVVFAMPPSVRLTELGLRQVDAEVVEAGEAFGASPMKILTRVQIPLALPTIMAGVNQVIMLALSMVVIAGMVGAGGLGAVIFRGVTRLDVGLGFEGGLSIVIIAVFLDRITAAFGDRASKRVSH